MAFVRQIGNSIGIMRFQGRDLRCALGAGGASPTKQEGDGATPTGMLSLRRVLYRADRCPPPACGVLQREPIAPDDGWCDDPGHIDYNRLVRLPHPGRHENLWREDGLYDLLVPLGHNDEPVQRGRGSAIFLHVAHPDLRPTQGCVALPHADLAWALANGLAAIDIPLS